MIQLLILVLPPSVLAAVLVLFLRGVARVRLERSEREAADLVEDAKALLSRGDIPRLRSVLESQRAPFARALLEILPSDLSMPLPSATSALMALRLRMRKERSPERTLLAILALALFVLSAWVGVVVLLYLANMNPGSGEVLAMGINGLIPWVATGVAVRSTWLLDRERAAYAVRLERWLMEVSSIIARVTSPPPDPPAVVS